MNRMPINHNKSRRGAIAVLAALLCVILLGMVAFAVDIGYLALGRTQLQAAADSAALAAAATASQPKATMVAVAQQFASANVAAGRGVQLNANDIQYGTWDSNARTFTPTSTASNAVKVTVRNDANNGGETALFFGRILGKASQQQSASAIATMNPRDIAFVVDLSGSMNNDTDPNSDSADDGAIQNVYTDFGFGTYSNPGNYQYAGQSLGISNTSSWVSTLTQSGGKLWGSTIPSKYRCDYNDTSSEKTWKAYAYVMEVQIRSAAVMPAAKPTPNAGTDYQHIGATYNFWKDYIDDNRSSLGYVSYMSYLMYNGRDNQPDGTDYMPLSLSSNLCACPMHNESVNGTSFSFPPREMPTHAMRRALIRAIQVVQTNNASISDPNQRDWVSIITFDKASSGSTTPKIEQPLTSDYNSVMAACTRLQAVGEGVLSTNTESGLSLAASHIKPQSQSGQGRENTNKIVILMTDGQPNLKQSSSSTISSYISANPNKWTNPNTGQVLNNWTVTGSYQTEQQGALMQTAMMQSNNWYVYAAGVGGASTDTDATNFLNDLARTGETADSSGHASSGGSNPTTYEDNMANIFKNIITNPKLRLVD
jgi:hypothetical protein